MNENPGETPNPLNNNPDNMPNDEPLDANPSEPLGDVTEPEEIIESTSVEESETSAEERPVSEGIDEPKIDNEPADKPDQDDHRETVRQLRIRNTFGNQRGHAVYRDEFYQFRD